MAVIVRVTNRRKKYIVLVKRGAGTVVNSNNTYSAHISSGDTLVVPDSNITNSIGTYNMSLPATTDLTVPDGSVRNSDNSWIAAVPAADSIIAPDIQVTDSDGSTYSYPSVKDVVCSLPVGSDVTNSDGSYNAHVNNGATLVLPDIQFTDSDGTISSVPACVDIVATPGNPPGEQFYVLFPSLYKSTVDMTVDASSAGTYAYEQSANTSSVVYEVNGTPVTMPFTVVNGDTLTVTIVKVDQDCLAVVEMTNIVITPYTFTSGNYVSAYPPAYNATYVKATSYIGGYEQYNTFNPAKSLTGTWAGNQWVALATANMRLHVDLGSAKVIGRIYYENCHDSGIYWQAGVKNFTLWGSNSASDFNDTTYANDGTWTQITGVSQSFFDKHVAENIADPKLIFVANTNAYRYYAFKFADNWSDGSFIGVRRIELQE